MDSSKQLKLKGLGIHKLASRFVPRYLSGETMDNRFASFESFGIGPPRLLPRLGSFRLLDVQTS